MGKKEERALKNQLIRLMQHIIKWFSQPTKRSKSWVNSINNARDEISDIKEDNPRFTQNFLQSIWHIVFKKATKRAEAEMGKKSEIEELTEKQVFEDEYKLHK